MKSCVRLIGAVVMNASEETREDMENLEFGLDRGLILASI